MTTHVTTRNPVRSDVSTAAADETAAGHARHHDVPHLGAGRHRRRRGRDRLDRRLRHDRRGLRRGPRSATRPRSRRSWPTRPSPILVVPQRRPGRRRPARGLRRRPAAPAPGPAGQRAPRPDGRLRRAGRHRRGLRAGHGPRHRVHRGSPTRSSSTRPARRCSTTGSARSRGAGCSPDWPASACTSPPAPAPSPAGSGCTASCWGGLTLLFGVSPLQYMAGVTGPLWLLVVASASPRRQGLPQQAGRVSPDDNTPRPGRRQTAGPAAASRTMSR